jgi:hypothetical protein
MLNNKLKRSIAQLLAASALALLPLASPVMAQDKLVTMETLLDRIQIEDFLTRYYYDLSEGKSHELSEYFTADAVLDVDSMIAKGHAEIGKLYERPAGSTPPPEPAAQRRRGHMLLTNPVIEVTGNTAVAHVIWTGVMNEGVGKVPNLYEQGREDTKLVKQNGKWLITHRCISSDSGLPDKFDATYKPRGVCWE